MVGKCTRIEKIEIENFKNVKYGQVVLKNRLYEQNGEFKK